MIMKHRLATFKTFAILTAGFCGSVVHSQDARFEFVDNADSATLEIAIGDLTHQLDLSDYLRNPSYVLDEFTFSHQEKTYAILSVGFPSRGEYTATGMCASGSEEFIVYLAFDQELKEVKQQVFAGASCLRGIYPDILSDDEGVSSLADLDLNFKTIKIAFETEEESWQHSLTRDDLSAFVRAPED